MLEHALDTVERLDQLSVKAKSIGDKSKTLTQKATIALSILNVLDKEHEKLEKDAPTSTKMVSAHITSTEESRAKLLTLRGDTHGD